MLRQRATYANVVATLALGVREAGVDLRDQSIRGAPGAFQHLASRTRSERA